MINQLTLFDDIMVEEKLFNYQERNKIISKLRKAANSATKNAGKINIEVSGNWTYRRQNMADGARKKKDRLLKNAVALNRLADFWEQDNCPEILKMVRSANDFNVYYPNPPDDGCPIGGWYREEYPEKLKKATRLGLSSKDDQTLFDAAIEKLSEVVLSEDEIKKRELDKKLVVLRASNIPGFFPTPDKVINEMIEHADIRDHHLVLEPSAGIGSIADKIMTFHPTINLFLVEINYSLVEILNLKGYSCTHSSIFEYECYQRYDRIIMNPPFEKKQDIHHVLHCYNNMLVSSGRLVSVMSAGVQSGTDAITLGFRKFVENNGYFIELGQKFNKADAFKNTGVNTVLVILNK